MYHFLIAIVILIFFYVLLKIFKTSEENDFPEAPVNKFFGSVFHRSPRADVLAILAEIFEQYGKTFKIRIVPSFAPMSGIMLTIDHKLTEYVLTNNDTLIKGKTYQYLQPWLGDGILLSEGLQWKRLKKIMTPFFHNERLKEHVQVFEKVGNKLIKQLEKYERVDNVDIETIINSCTLDIICESGLGNEEVEEFQKNQYLNGLKQMNRIFNERCWNPLKGSNNTFWLTKDYNIQKETLKILQDFSSSLIESKKEKKLITNKNRKNMDFLDLFSNYVEDGKIFPNDKIRYQVNTILFGGADTSATGICFTLYCLANNPEIQDKVFQEQQNLFGNEKNPAITFFELHRMKYLHNVIKEALRLFPPTPFLGRKVNKDTEFDGHVIRKGTDISIYVYGIHRHQEYFPEPDKFNPDRFNNPGDVIPYTYLAFSGGPRKCPGQQFALLEMKTIISNIIRHFEVQPATPKHELKLVFETLLKSDNGFNIRFKKRE